MCNEFLNRKLNKNTLQRDMNQRILRGMALRRMKRLDKAKSKSKKF